MIARRLYVAASIAMAALCAVLAAAVYSELGRKPVPPRLAPANPVKSMPLLPNAATPASLPAVTALSALVEKPLFFPARRLPDPEPEEPTKPTARPDLAIKVTGVIITPKRSVALVRIPPSTDTLHLSIGDRVGDWRLQKIFKDRIVLGLETETKEVIIEDTPPPRARKVPQKLNGGAQRTPSARRNNVPAGTPNTKPAR